MVTECLCSTPEGIGAAGTPRMKTHAFTSRYNPVFKDRAPTASHEREADAGVAHPTEISLLFRLHDTPFAPSRPTFSESFPSLALASLVSSTGSDA